LKDSNTSFSLLSSLKEIDKFLSILPHDLRIENCNATHANLIAFEKNQSTLRRYQMLLASKNLSPLL